MKNFRIALLVVIFLLAGCGKQAQAIQPTLTAVSATVTYLPAEMGIPPTEMPAQDLTLFGAIGTGEIQAFALESVAIAVFAKVMDGLKADGIIQEYQATSVTIFPGGNGLFAEIIYNVRTTDPAWLIDGGAQSPDGWINGNCSRFDFFTTKTEYQLKNRRVCG